MSLYENGGLSAADVAAVTGNNGGGFGWGGDGSFWIIILFLFAFMGNGWGWGSGNGSSASADVQRGFDQQSVMNGINGLTTAVSNGFANAEVSRCNAQANVLQAMNNLSSGLADIKYSVATEACSDRQAVNDGIRDLMAANTANTQNLMNVVHTSVQGVMDKICALELEGKNQTIQNLQTQLNMSVLRESQNAQTAQILANNAAQTAALEQYLNPTPIPAYTVANPNCCPPAYSDCACRTCGG